MLTKFNFHWFINSIHNPCTWERTPWPSIKLGDKTSSTVTLQQFAMNVIDKFLQTHTHTHTHRRVLGTLFEASIIYQSRMSAREQMFAV